MLPQYNVIPQKCRISIRRLVKLYRSKHIMHAGKTCGNLNTVFLYFQAGTTNDNLILHS